MVTSLHRLFSRRVKARESTSRPHLRRREFGVEPLEIRRYFATYDLDSFSFEGAPIAGWPVIGAGNLTLEFSHPFNTSVSTALTFTSPSNATVNVNFNAAANATNGTATIPPGVFHQPLWGGTAFNATLSLVGDTLTGNTTIPINPSNIASIGNNSITVDDAANLTLVATDPAFGFGNLASHNFFLVGGPNGTVSASVVGSSTDSTHLTVTVPQGAFATAGSYTLQTTPSGTTPANATDTANFALVGNLNVSVNAINYTIASITYQNSPISGWSYFGSGSENITITLANGSTPFTANQQVWFSTSQSINGTVGSNNLTLNTTVPYFGAYNGTSTFQNLSFGATPSNNNTINGTFSYHNVSLLNISTNQAYLAGGGNLTLTANSAVYGFGNEQNLTVIFASSSNSSVNPASAAANSTNSTSLTVTIPGFGNTTGNYSVFLPAPKNLNGPASNSLPFTVLANPVIDNLTITFQNNTGLTANTSPVISDLYLYVFGKLNDNQGFFDINATTGNVGNIAHSTNASNAQNGVVFTTLNNSTLFFNLAGGAYNGTRVYFSTESNLTSQPEAGFGLAYYDFIEIAASNASIFADTSQVDQFGMPFTINLTLNGNGQTLIPAASAGINHGLTRQDIITGYNTAFANVAGYNQAIVPLGGLGNDTSPTYRVLAPNDLLNAITANAKAWQQDPATTFTITPQNTVLGNYSNWAYLNITTGGNINGLDYPKGSPVSGPFIPAGTVIAETNPVGNATSFKIATNQTIANATPFSTATINGTMAFAFGGVRLQQVSSNMTSVGYQALTNAFGPSVYNFAANGSPVAWDNVTLNQNNAIDLMFNRYMNATQGGLGYFWYQEENQPADVLNNSPSLYPQTVALYRGEVTTTTNTSIDGTTANYTVLRFIDYTNGSANNNLTLDIYYPYFTTNSPAGKVDPFGNSVPAPPSWFTQDEGNFKTPSLQVFGGAGIFQPGGNLTGGTAVALNDLGRDVAVALSRGYSSTMLSTGEAINIASNPNLPVFQHTNAANTTGTWTMPTSVYTIANPTSESIVNWVAASYLNFNSPMTITGVSTVGANTVIDVVSFVSGDPINITAGKNIDNLQFVDFADNSSVYPNGAGSIPYNMYESFIQSRGDFVHGVSDGSGTEPVNIDGLGYGYAFSDFMGLSSTISVNAVTTASAPAVQSAALIVTMQPWFSDAPSVVTYDIDSVTFESQVITGWSLFGSGTDQVTITTTANSTPFNQNATYSLAFGGLNATGMATATNTLTVSVPVLKSLWTGIGGNDFANLSFLSANSTTGNTTFNVLAVNLTAVTPNNGLVEGNTALTLTAFDKQHGFGNATNLSVFFSRNGVTAGASNVAVVNSTTLSLSTPTVAASGNWTLGVYEGLFSLSPPYLASNNLTYVYTEDNLILLSGDFNGDGLTDIATLLDNGNWQVSFTQAAGNAVSVSLNASNHWATNATWVDWSVLRSGAYDMIVARYENPGISNSWWNLVYGGFPGTAIDNFSTNFLGSWNFSAGSRWIDVVDGDFDGDGNADIIGRDSVTNQWWMLANATQTANDATFAAKNVFLGAWSSEREVQWDQTLAGNFKGNQNGKAQVAGLTGSTWWVSEYNGTPGSMNHTKMSTNWGRHENYTDYQVGNFDGVRGPVLIAGKTENNAWYSIGYNASITPENNTPSLMGIWPDHTSTYSNVLTGDFFGSGTSGYVGIAGLKESNGNLSWSVLERSPNGGNYTVSNFGTWPQSTVAQAFAGFYSSSDFVSKRTGVLTRTQQQGGILVWERGISNGTAFTASAVTGYPT